MDYITTSGAAQCMTVMLVLLFICPDGESEVNMSDSSYLKSSRLESQSSETDLEGLPGEEGKGETKKKKNRQHKKKQWATILRDLNLRVMSKLVKIILMLSLVSIGAIISSVKGTMG